MWRSDAELLGAAEEGDEEAWVEIIARYQSLINAISRRHRLAPSDAKDVSQYVWLQLLSHIDKLREPRALSGWTGRCPSARSVHAHRRPDPRGRNQTEPATQKGARLEDPAEVFTSSLQRR
jgi:DNA-directed RNA polymerase specialized sigma24 family protein